MQHSYPITAREQGAHRGGDVKGATRSRTWGRLGCPAGRDLGRGQSTHVFEGLRRMSPTFTAVAQPVVHDGDDAHEQGVTGPLRAVRLRPLQVEHVLSPSQESASTPTAPHSW